MSSTSRAMGARVRRGQRSSPARRSRQHVVRGSGDFLKDMGYADPDEMRVKFVMANAIALAIEDRALTQGEAAKLTGLVRSDVARIVNGAVKDYPFFRLMQALTALGKDISIEIRGAASKRGAVFAHSS